MLYLQGSLYQKGVGPAELKLMGHDDVRSTRQWYFDLTGDQRRHIGERIPV